MQRVIYHASGLEVPWHVYCKETVIRVCLGHPASIEKGTIRMLNSLEKRTLVVAGLFLLVIVGFSPALRAEVVSAEVSVESSVEPDANEDQWKEPWRGSSFTYRNVATAVTFNRDAELGYNPYYAMSWMFGPRWWLGDVFNMSASLSLTRELTHSDWSTYEGETQVSDFVLGVGAARFVTIPVLDIGISASLKLIAPSSKSSQARTMIMGIKPGLALSRSFDVLSGINLGYSFSVTKTFHEATTAQREEPNIAGCVGTAEGCETYMNTGARNSSWGLYNGFSLGVGFVDWLSMSANFGLLHSILYKQEDVEGELMSEWQPGDDDTNVRYIMLYGLELAAKPNPALTVAIGADTANGQLAPDSSYQKPFFNRYTAIYLDLRLDFAGLTSQLTSSEE